VRRLEGRGHAVALLDPAELRLPLLDRMYKEYPPGTAPEPLATIAGRIRAADGVVVVTGEYNHMPPPALVNLLDHFLEDWFWRPSAIVSYSAGAFGGVRAASHLRDMLAELGMPSIPSSLPVPAVQDAFDDDGTPRDPAWDRRVGRFLDELEWYARALAAERARGVPY
jgi:NAD(P)H-dependent FMN reductase